jgi:hypothetical protein
MKMSNDREWLRKRAEQEDRHFVSLGVLTSPLEEEHPKAEQSELSTVGRERDRGFGRIDADRKRSGQLPQNLKRSS